MAIKCYFKTLRRQNNVHDTLTCNKNESNKKLVIITRFTVYNYEGFDMFWNTSEMSP